MVHLRRVVRQRVGRLGGHRRLDHLRARPVDREHDRRPAQVAAHARGVTRLSVLVLLPGQPPRPPPPHLVVRDLGVVQGHRQGVDHVDQLGELPLGVHQVQRVPVHVQGRDRRLDHPHCHGHVVVRPLAQHHDPPKHVIDDWFEAERSAERADDVVREHVHARDSALPVQDGQALQRHQEREQALELDLRLGHDVDRLVPPVPLLELVPDPALPHVRAPEHARHGGEEEVPGRELGHRRRRESGRQRDQQHAHERDEEEARAEGWDQQVEGQRAPEPEPELEHEHGRQRPRGLQPGPDPGRRHEPDDGRERRQA